MEFVKPLLSLSDWNLKVFPVRAAANLPLAKCDHSHSTAPRDGLIDPKVDSFHTEYDNVFTMRRSRARAASTGRSTRVTASTRRLAEAPGSAPHPPRAPQSLPAAMQARQPMSRVNPAQAAVPPAQQLQLKIVQREPRQQPERVLISGRMADVCAALERLARNERVMQA